MSQSQVPSRSTALSLTLYNHTHPSPYQSPQSHTSPVIVVNINEFSDGEEPNIDLAEENDHWVHSTLIFAFDSLKKMANFLTYSHLLYGIKKKI